MLVVSGQYSFTIQYRVSEPIITSVFETGFDADNLQILEYKYGILKCTQICQYAVFVQTVYTLTITP